MLRRFFTVIGSPGVTPGFGISSVVTVNENSHQITQTTTLTGGVAGATVVIRLANYYGAHPAQMSFYVAIPGVGTLNTIGQTFSIVLDASGSFSFTTITDAGTPSGGSIVAVLAIISTTSGTIGSPSSWQYNHTS